MFTNWLTTPTTKSTASSPSTTSQISGTGGGGVGVHHPPPDIVIEVGPPPFAQFAAHSSLLIAHSGYMRAVLHHENGGPPTKLDNTYYVPNVTADQFAPLLTYMYTGFLDLTIENIFGVLLATHILHMPRALEICRQFLSRSQAENYFSGFLATQQPPLPPPIILPTTNIQTVIRPIPNKLPTHPTGLSFISPPSTQAPHTLKPSQHTNFHKISTKEDIEPVPSTSTNKPSEKKKLKKCVKISSENQTTESITTNRPKPESEYIVPQPELSSSKIIIDVASCDGPVRFRRVLNEAYGKHATNDDKSRNKNPIQHDAQQSPINISSSFHQQMAKNINERKHRNICDESENSEDTTHNHPLNTTFNQSSGGGGGGNSKEETSNEIFVCVYCKHTFKSQYCYQKHAKRHLNPPTIDSNSSSDAIVDIDVDVDDSGGDQPPSNENDESFNLIKQSKEVVSPMLTLPLYKREVRALDMNVQYYPCKTCGCKFPSYYFVHKHRKMCHADEEN